MILRPLVNTDVPMSQDMMEALTELEFYFIGVDRDTTDEQEVRDFLRVNSGEALANEFNTNFLYRSLDG